MSARQWFPSGWVCSKSLQLSCVACLKLEIVVRLSKVVWGVTHPSLLCWGENVKHSGWEWFCDCHPQGRSLPGPSWARLPGNSKLSMQCSPVSMRSSITPTPLLALYAPGRGRSPRSSSCRGNAHHYHFYSTENLHSWVSLFREAAASQYNNNASITTTVIIPAANTLFSTDYRPNSLHKIVSFDCLSNPIG